MKIKLMVITISTSMIDLFKNLFKDKLKQFMIKKVYNSNN